MVRAANKFERIKSKIGDVHPANILINDDGQVKMISTCSLPNEQNNFEKAVEHKDAKVFLGKIFYLIMFIIFGFFVLNYLAM